MSVGSEELGNWYNHFPLSRKPYGCNVSVMADGNCGVRISHGAWLMASR